MLVSVAFEAQQRHDRQATGLFDDVTEFLSKVNDAGILTAVVTNNSPESQRERLAIVGLDEEVDAVVISGELGVAKPEPGPFREALNRLGVAAEETWHVGDDLTTDVAGAKNAGLFAVWLNRHGVAPTEPAAMPDWEIKTLTEISDCLGPAD